MRLCTPFATRSLFSPHLRYPPDTTLFQEIAVLKVSQTKDSRETQRTYKNRAGPKSRTTYQRRRKATLPHNHKNHNLDHKSLHLILQVSDLAHQITRFVGGNAGRDNRSADTAGAAEGRLGWHVDVGNVFILCTHPCQYIIYLHVGKIYYRTAEER